jgi:hypothetical protein
MYPSGYVASAALAAARGVTDIHPNRQLDTAIDEAVALRTAISRVGNNLNQIAHVYNSGGHPRPGALDRALTVLTRSLARIDDAADALVQSRH